LFVSVWPFTADTVNPFRDKPTSIGKVHLQATNVLVAEFKGITTAILNTTASKNICPQRESNPKLPALRGDEVRNKKWSIVPDT
jgi:hypothetical protein